MPLAQQIGELRDRVLGELQEIHDYYHDTTIAWRVLQQSVANGRSINAENEVTGTVTTGSDLAARAQGYVAGYLAEATFVQFVASFEIFFVELLQAWLTAYPRSLAQAELKFESVLDAPDKESVVRDVVRREVDKLAYKRPKEWFDYLAVVVKLRCPAPDEIARVAEAKASRDLLIHNRGVVTRAYILKAGDVARYTLNQRVEVSTPYHRATWELLRKVVSDLATAAIAKCT
ncbi:MAG: hypothetical protein HYX69_01670 [Planctomycetia bacterium]|nr:hypothetical protein [Planctomycetia bacterium]